DSTRDCVSFRMRESETKLLRTRCSAFTAMAESLFQMPVSYELAHEVTVAGAPVRCPHVFLQSIIADGLPRLLCKQRRHFSVVQKPENRRGHAPPRNVTIDHANGNAQS